jgi:Gluconate 2-dehydrogenase subunit 3
MTMNRREALTAAAALLGGTIIGAQAFLTGCVSPEKKDGVFSPEDIGLLDEIGETILPTTAKSPGAKAAKIGEFMKTMVIDCYSASEQKIFFEGLAKFSEYCVQRGGHFLKLDDQVRISIVSAIDKEAEAHSKSKADKDPEHYFSMIKQLTILGYFSSEPGATKALRYVPIPGRYEGCVEYKKGDGAWLY